MKGTMENNLEKTTRKETIQGIDDPNLVPLMQEADAMQAFMEAGADLTDANSLPARLAEMDVYAARASEMSIKAKALRERKRNEYEDDNASLLSQMKPTEAKRATERHLYQYTMAAERTEKLYAALTQSCRTLITQISYAKKQLELQGGIPRCA